MITDEKVLGTAHVAFGDNASPSYGGDNQAAAIHVDGVMADATIEADGEVVMVAGESLDEARSGPEPALGWVVTTRTGRLPVGSQRLSAYEPRPLTEYETVALLKSTDSARAASKELMAGDLGEARRQELQQRVEQGSRARNRLVAEHLSRAQYHGRRFATMCRPPAQRRGSHAGGLARASSGDREVQPASRIPIRRLRGNPHARGGQALQSPRHGEAAARPS